MGDNPWTLTVRNGPQVSHSHYETLNAALDAMQVRLDELEPEARRDSVSIYKRRFEPVKQVAVRAEVAGPGGWLFGSVRGGVDMRGDGSSEAYIGRIRRSLVALREGESPIGALRRVLGEPGQS